MRIKKTVALLLTIVMLFGTAACSTTNNSENAQPTDSAITFTDDLGRQLSIDKKPSRVATLIGSFADIWCLAGGKESLVATAHDSWTSFDLGLSEDVADIGAIKKPNFEIIMSAEPDFVIASCNTKADLELQSKFEELGINVAYFDVQNFDDYLNMLKICTELTGCPDNYKQYGEAVAELVDASIARKDGSAPSVLCIRATGSSCKVKGSVDNVLGEMLADLGCVNVADSDNSLLENLSIEAIIEADPDYIFAVLQGSDSSDAQKVLEDTLLSNPAWGTLTAVKENRFFVLENSLYNLKPNSNWGVAYEKLADILFTK